MKVFAAPAERFTECYIIILQTDLLATEDVLVSAKVSK